MKTLRAEVRNGRLTLDEPTSLPEGTVLELAQVDIDDDLDEAERAALHAALDASWESVRRKETNPVEDILDRLKER